MVVVASVACVLALQQLHVEPYPAHVGEPVVVTASGADGPLVGVEVSIEPPGGVIRQLGPTDAAGRVTFVPDTVGQFVYAAEVGGVRLLAPHRVVAKRERWWLALGSVPLGLALLWRLSRARGRRDP